MRELKVVVVGVLVCAVLAGRASGTTYGTVNTQLVAWPGEAIDYRYTRPGHVSSGSGEVAGVYKMDIVGSAPTGLGTQLPDPFHVVCVDLLTTIYAGPVYDWTIEDLKDVPDSTSFGPMGAARARDLAELFGRHNPNTLASNAQRAAMGVLAWEIVLEDAWDGQVGEKPWGLSGGYLTIGGLSAAARSCFNTWAGELTGAGGTGSVYALHNESTQDFGVVLPGPGQAGHTPEPLTLLALSSAVAGIAGYIRKRRLA